MSWAFVVFCLGGSENEANKIPEAAEQQNDKVRPTRGRHLELFHPLRWVWSESRRKEREASFMVKAMRAQAFSECAKRRIGGSCAPRAMPKFCALCQRGFR
jgi:hypothetical protein